MLPFSRITSSLTRVTRNGRIARGNQSSLTPLIANPKATENSGLKSIESDPFDCTESVGTKSNESDPFD